MFSFGASADKPAFSFGAPADKKDEKPAFSFNAPAKKEGEENKLAFSFGAPAGDKKEGEDNKPAFSFSFNTPAADKKDEKPAFSFNFTAPNSNPAFTFAANAKPAFAAPAPEVEKPAETPEDDDDTMEGQKGVTVLHSVRAKLYTAKKGGWESQGVGTFRIEEFM